MGTYTRNAIQFEKDLPESAFEMICSRILTKEEEELFLDYNEIAFMPEPVRRVNALEDDTLYTTKDPAVLLYKLIQSESVSIKDLWQVLKDANEYDLSCLAKWAGFQLKNFCISDLKVFAQTDFGKKLYALGQTITQNKEIYGAGTYEEWCAKNWGATGYGYDVSVNASAREIVFTMHGRPVEKLVRALSDVAYWFASFSEEYLDKKCYYVPFIWTYAVQSRKHDSGCYNFDKGMLVHKKFLEGTKEDRDVYTRFA